MKIHSILGLSTLVFASSCTAIDLEKKPNIDVEACAGDADIDDTTFIVWEFEDSVHEMLTCGNLSFLLIRALLDSGKDLLSGDAKLPEAFSYEDGAYGAYGAHGKLSSVSVPCDVIRRLSVQVFLPHPGCLDCAHATAMG